MRVVKIPKGGGKFRTIYVANAEEKKKCYAWMPHLEMALDSLPPRVLNCIHGFRRRRSAVSNAKVHCGYAHTVSFDIASFFDSITEKQVREATAEMIYRAASTNGAASVEGMSLSDILVDGAPRQGLPTSPIIANLVGAKFDEHIIHWLDLMDSKAVYTRYADDMTISSDSMEVIERALVKVPFMLKEGFGFTVAAHKTKVQHAAAGRRIITGVAVDTDVHPTRRVKRKLRAARHQQHGPQATGLAEWCKTRLPKEYMSDLARMFAELADMLKTR